MKRIALVTAIMLTSAGAFAQEAKPGAAPASPAAPADAVRQEGKALGHQKKGMKKGHDKRHDKAQEGQGAAEEKSQARQHDKGHGKAHMQDGEHAMPAADAKGKGGDGK